MKKIFGGINLTWPKIIIMALIMGIYTALVCIIPSLLDTSFHDIAVTFEVWVFFGIFIIMNSKSNVDSALKCFVFFLISQPLVYLLQVPFKEDGWQLLSFYPFWFGLTVLCLPMGYIGYYLKKDKWWGLFILCPMILLVGDSYLQYLNRFLFAIPQHLLTVIFCAVTMVAYPLLIFKNKVAKIVSTVFAGLLIVVFTIICFIKPSVYETIMITSGGSNNVIFEKGDKAYLEDETVGTVTIEYEESIETYVIKSHFKKAGETNLVIENKYGDVYRYKVTNKQYSYVLDRQLGELKGLDQLISYDVLDKYIDPVEDKTEDDKTLYQVSYNEKKGEGLFQVGIFAFAGKDVVNGEEASAEYIIGELTNSETVEVDGRPFYFGYTGSEEVQDVVAKAYVYYGDYVIVFSMHNGDDKVTSKQYEDFKTMVKSVKFLK